MVSVEMAYPYSMWFFIIQQASSGLYTWRVGRVPAEKVEVSRPLEALACNCHLHWIPLVKGQNRYKGRENRVQLLIKVVAKSHYKGAWIKGERKIIMAIFFLAICHTPQFIFFIVIFIILFLSLYERYCRIGYFPGTYPIIISI